MPKKCLLLFAQSSVEKGLADPVALTKLLNATEKDMEAVWAYFDDLIYSISNDQVDIFDTRNDCSIRDYTVVYLRYWGAQEGHGIGVARICNLLGIPFIDREALRLGSHNKITQYVNLYEAKVPIPKTLIAHGAVLTQQYAQYGFTFPLIIKDKGGTRGERNYLVKSHDELLRVIDAHPEITFVLQEFVPNDGDYRVWVVGDEVKLVIHRQAPHDSHLNNTSKGGKAQIVPLTELPPHVLQDCVHASAFFGRQIAGVDILRRTNSQEYYCLEVNRSPQAEGASFEKEKAEILAEYLASL